MRQLQLLIGCCLTVLCWNVSSAQARVGDDKDGAAPLHKQAKFAGRADNLANATPQQTKANEANKQSNAETTKERRPLSQEERRALRRQISETEMKYPRR